MIIYTRAENSQRFHKTDFSTQSVESLFVNSLFPSVERSPLSCITSYGPKYIFVSEEEYQAARTKVLVKLDIMPSPEPAEATVLALATVSVTEATAADDPHKDLPF